MSKPQLVKHLSPNCKLGKSAISALEKLVPGIGYVQMEIMGDGTIVFTLKDSDRTRWGIDIIHLVKNYS